jgi:hypothetical protein
MKKKIWNAPKLTSVKPNAITLFSSLYNCDMYIDGYINNIRSLINFSDHYLYICNITDSNTVNTNKKIKNLSKEFNNVFLFEQKKQNDTGLYNSWNEMIQLIQTDLACNLNADDKIHPNFLIYFSDLFANNPEYDVCSCVCYTSKNITDTFENTDGLDTMYYNKCYIKHNGKPVKEDNDIIHTLVHNKVSNIKTEVKWDTFEKQSITIFDFFRFQNETVYLFNFLGCCPVFRKSIVTKCGIFNETDFGSAADAEFWLRAYTNGCKFHHSLEKYIIYYVNDKSYARVDSGEQGKNNDKIIQKYSPFTQLNRIYTNTIVPVNTTYESTLIQSQTLNSQNKLFYYDNNWQYPVITEKRVFELLKDTKTPFLSEINCNYFAFPWATLIDDFVKNKSVKYVDIIGNFKVNLGESKTFTVCQHIRFRFLLPLFKSIGITHVFASHCSKYDYIYEKHYGIHIIPFQLYPANSFENYNDVVVAKHFLSFCGAYDERYYLSNIRDKLKSLTQYKDCYIELKNQWHFELVVYKEQVANTKLTVDEITEQNAKESQYLDILKSSTFSLCPSGTGPNSIRLWEAMSVGSIPVILSDHTTLDKMIEWNNYVVIWPENNIDKLYVYLKSLPRHRINRMRQNCIDLFNERFSKQNFHIPIISYFRNFTGKNLLISNDYPAHYEVIESIICKYKTIINADIDNIYLSLIKDDNWEYGLNNKYSFIDYIKNKYPTIRLCKPIKSDYFIECTLQTHHYTLLTLPNHYFLSHRNTESFGKYNNIFYIKNKNSTNNIICDVLPYTEQKHIDKNNKPIYILSGGVDRKDINSITRLLNTTVNYDYTLKILTQSSSSNLSYLEKLKTTKNFDKVKIYFNLTFEEFHTHFIDAYCLLTMLNPNDNDYFNSNKISANYSYQRAYDLYSITNDKIHEIYSNTKTFQYNDSNIETVFLSSLEYYYNPPKEVQSKVVKKYRPRVKKQTLLLGVDTKVIKQPPNIQPDWCICCLNLNKL